MDKYNSTGQLSLTIDTDSQMNMEGHSHPSEHLGDHEEDDDGGVCFHAEVYNQTNKDTPPTPACRHLGAKLLDDTTHLLHNLLERAAKERSQSRSGSSESRSHHGKMNLRRLKMIFTAVRRFRRLISEDDVKRKPSELDDGRLKQIENCIITPELEEQFYKIREIPDTECDGNGAGDEMLVPQSISRETSVDECASQLNILNILDETDGIDYEISDVFVNHPEGEVGEKKVAFGMKLLTLFIDGYYIHFCVDVEKGELAEQFELRESDELLMINSNGVINKPHQNALQLFAQLKTRVAITLISRRYVNLNQGLKDDDSEVEYIRTLGEFYVKEEGEKQDYPLVKIIDTNVSRWCPSQPGIRLIFKMSHNIFTTHGKRRILGFDGTNLFLANDIHTQGDQRFEFDVWSAYWTNSFNYAPVVVICPSGSNLYLKAESDGSTSLEEHDFELSEGTEFSSGFEGLLFRVRGATSSCRLEVLNESEQCPEIRKYLTWDDDGEELIYEEQTTCWRWLPSEFIFELHDI